MLTARIAGDQNVCVKPQGGVIGRLRQRAAVCAADRVRQVAALPDTNVWRDADALASIGCQVRVGASASTRCGGPPARRRRSARRPSRSPGRCPPRPKQPDRAVGAARRSRRWTGWAGTVLPMPYHMHPDADPAPERRSGCRRGRVEPRASIAQRRPVRRERVETRRRGPRSPPGDGPWPSRTRRAARSAGGSRAGRCQRASARSSSSASWAIAAWGTPNPRNAPDGGPFVWTARDVHERRVHSVRPGGMDRDAVGDRRTPRRIRARVEVAVEPDARQPSVDVRPEGRLDPRGVALRAWRAIDSGRVQTAAGPAGPMTMRRSRAAAGSRGRACHRSRRRRRSG